MAETTTIAWTNSTFNPWSGCTRVSPGCDHCYAEALSERFPTAFGSWKPGAPRKRTSKTYWREPVKWNREAGKSGKPHRVFCASMGDVFDNQAPPEWRTDLFNLIAATPYLTWQLLTKRPQNIADMLPQDWCSGWQNVWLGTTIENQEEADQRIPHLLAVPAALRFLSVEPMLGPVDLLDIPWPKNRPRFPATDDLSDARSALHPIENTQIGWVIVGGESGHKARPLNPAWVRDVLRQCKLANVPFFFKQVGSNGIGWPLGNVGHGTNVRDWPTDLQVQQLPQDDGE